MGTGEQNRFEQVAAMLGDLRAGEGADDAAGHDIGDRFAAEVFAGGIGRGEAVILPKCVMDSEQGAAEGEEPEVLREDRVCRDQGRRDPNSLPKRKADFPADPAHQRSEENTSELQTLMRISYADLCL